MRANRCFECEFEVLDRPCQNDPQILAEAYIAGGALEISDGEELHWAWECLHSAIQQEPDFALAAILRIYPKIDTPEKAATFAAGHLEDLIRAHGPMVIDQFEAEAKTSAKFAYILSGVWSPHDSDAAHWVRLRALQAKGPHMDRADPIPES